MAAFMLADRGDMVVLVRVAELLLLALLLLVLFVYCALVLLLLIKLPVTDDVEPLVLFVLRRAMGVVTVDM